MCISGSTIITHKKKKKKKGNEPGTRTLPSTHFDFDPWIWSPLGPALGGVGSVQEEVQLMVAEWE